MKQPRFSREDWIALGFEALRKDGIAALTIEALCKRARKTRGSFYFHFESTDRFLLALATSWKETFTDQITSHTPKTPGRIDLLNQLAGRLDPALETGIRQLAVINADVAAIVTRADNERVVWLGRLYDATSRYRPGDAHRLAEIEYAAFIGFRLIRPDMNATEARSFYAAFLEFTGR